MIKSKYLLLLALLIIALILGTGIGSVYISPIKIFSILLHKVFNTSLIDSVKNTDIAIIYHIRLPRVLIAALIGGSLAMSGAAIQSLLRNPLASPYTLGVSSGASLGVALVISFHLTSPFLSNMFLPVVGFLSSLVTVILILYLARKIDRNYSTNTIILVGIVSSLFINGLLTLVIALSGDELKNIIFWQMGSLSLRGYDHLLGILPFVIIGSIGLLVLHKELDALAFGEESAKNIGVNTQKVKILVILFSATLTGSAIAISGIIGFVGLVSPHIVKRIYGQKHLTLLPISFLFGGIFLILTDLIARTIVSPSELPVGSITALIGAPFFAFIFFYKRGK